MRKTYLFTAILTALLLVLGLGPSPFTGFPAMAQEEGVADDLGGIDELEKEIAEEETSKKEAPAAGEVTVYENGKRYHIVQKGENLHLISAKYYKSARKWRLIYEANLEVLENPNGLQPGMKLLIPEE